jgi:hypothetical protein
MPPPPSDEAKENKSAESACLVGLRASLGASIPFSDVLNGPWRNEPLDLISSVVRRRGNG